MMYGLPRQSLDEALDDLKQVIKLQPEHISWYQLTIEPNTAFAHQPPLLPDCDSSAEIQENGIELLQINNFKRYEISAYSKPGKKCQHNLNYWRFGDYLGLGAGGHGKLSSKTTAIRDARTNHPKDYLRHAGSIPDTELVFEYLLNRLRLTEGFPLDDMKRATGMTITQFTAIARKSINKGLLNIHDNYCNQTEAGYRHMNDILLDFLP